MSGFQHAQRFGSRARASLPTVTAIILSGIGFATSAASGQEHALRCQRGPALVPAVDEITILDPHINSEAKPTAIVYAGTDGQQRVDVPPAVIVHNFYYTGDRDFRGPAFPGGPSIVVVNHPDTGERHYLDVQMLPGSPRVIYRRHSIDYDYGFRRIHIAFGNPQSCLPLDVARVTYVHGHPRKLEPLATQGVHGNPVVQWIDRTGIPHATHHVVVGAHNTLDYSADVLHRAGEQVAAPVVRVFQATPLGSIADGHGQEDAVSQRNQAVQRAEALAARNDVTIPTNR